MQNRRINLIPKSERPQAQVSAALILVACASIVVCGIAVSWIRVTGSAREASERYRAQARALGAVQEKLVAQGNGNVSEEPLTTQALNPLEAVLKNKSVWSEPLKELSGLVPDGVWLSKLVNAYDKTGARTVVVSGSAASEEKVAQFFNSLEQSFYFRHVLIKFSERQKDVAPMLYNFEFVAPLKPGTKVVANESH